MTRRQTTVMTKCFDLAGNGIGRVAGWYARWRIFPVGGFGGGPGLLPLAVLWCVHRLGRPICWLVLRFEPRSGRLLRRVLGRRSP